MMVLFVRMQMGRTRKKDRPNRDFSCENLGEFTLESKQWDK